MNPEPVPGLSWERAGLIVGVLLALVTLAAKLKWIADRLARFAAWLGWKSVWFLIHSDSEKSKNAILKLFPDEVAASEKARRLVGELEGAVVELHQSVAAMRKEMADERRDIRFDIQAAGARYDNNLREVREKVDGLRNVIEAQNTTMQTVLAAVLGPEETRRRLREKRAREERER